MSLTSMSWWSHWYIINHFIRVFFIKFFAYNGEKVLREQITYIFSTYIVASLGISSLKVANEANGKDAYYIDGYAWPYLT